MTSPGGPQLLVVDDDPTTRLWMRATLTKAGFGVGLAANGTDALSLFDAQRFDMALLDVQLPDIDGLSLCRTLRERVGEALPIVMVTGADDVDSVERAFEAGATDFVAKPINWPLLAHRVRYVLRATAAFAHEREAAARQAALLAALPDAWMRLDSQGRVIQARRAPAAAAAAPLAEPGQPWPQDLPPDEQAAIDGARRRALQGAGVQTFEFHHRSASGERLDHEGRMVAIDEGEALCLLRDITERRRAEDALRRSRAQLAQAHAIARLGHWQLDLAARRLEWSAELRAMVGLDPDALADAAQVAATVAADDLPRVRRTWHAARRGQPVQQEYRVQVRGQQLWLQEHAEPQRDESGAVVSVIGTVQDITQRKAVEEQVRRLAYFDTLTGLPNRSSFLDRLQRALRRAHGGQARLAVLFMDLDGFKAVNDTMGHDAGDIVLEEAAQRLRSALRANDLVARHDETPRDAALARLGGDEFTALILDMREPEDALRVAQRIAAEIRKPFVVRGRTWSLTASIGVAVCPDDGSDAATLLKNADTAMYHAKGAGRDAIRFYDPALTERALARAHLEHDLREALPRGQFALAFQPQIDAANGRVVAVEALLRWRHPQRGEIDASEFVPAAEAIGLMVPLGEWMLAEACRHVAAWRDAGIALRVTVNATVRQLRGAGFVDTVQRALGAVRLAPESLEVEVAETDLMAAGSEGVATLAALRAIGVRLALDDFGTGYSSLAVLKRLSLNTLKIDRSLVMGLPGDKDDDSIVRAVLSMSSSLGFDVVAEGVDTADQAAALLALGCARLQGLQFSRPVSALDVPRLVAALGETTVPLGTR
ncbi:MAG TPA: EAL domain-containing protein [Burkholderiaceae bacterium]|nr:EAL domain-containing protein [Burkholderiaceae bacterium]